MTPPSKDSGLTWGKSEAEYPLKAKINHNQTPSRRSLTSNTQDEEARLSLPAFTPAAPADLNF